jgi:DNA-binding NtrC family response regulator
MALQRKVLVVDDDQSFREVMRFHLASTGCQVLTAGDGEEALEVFAAAPVPVVVTDLKMPGLDGMKLLSELERRAPDTLVIMITAFGEVETAVEAMKAGAFDFVPKPCDRAHLLHVVNKAFEHVELHREVKDLRRRLQGGSRKLIYTSSAMRAVVSAADKVARSDVSVVITGESGTGKELVARRIHEQSPRSSGPFVAVNCSSIPASLLESELFGHKKGAFTGADRSREGRFIQANGGTLFLDEIAEMPLELQPRLLRALQERAVDVVGGDQPIPVDVRILSATNADLDAAVDNGRLRKDLFFRIGVFPIHIPPLRQRPEDIAVLMSHMLKSIAEGQACKVTPDLLTRLESHPWPGNVRELENIVQRLVLLADSQQLDVSLLHGSPGFSASGPAPTATPFTLPPTGLSLYDLERQVIEQALKVNDYNQSKTAEFLQIPRHKLLYRMDKYSILGSPAGGNNE